MNEQMKQWIGTIAIGAAGLYLGYSSRPGQLDDLFPALPTPATPSLPAPAARPIGSVKLGPVDCFYSQFGKMTHVWVVAPATGKTFEFDVSESDIVIPPRRTVGDVGSQQ